MKNAIILFVASCLGTVCCTEKNDKVENHRPNILLMMGDDIGFSDLSCYGGEIPTPNLDRLADQGIRFRQFYNMSKCETTRSSLLTGLYRGDDRALSFINLFEDAGYDTYHFGKEHFLNWVPDRCYARNVCDESLTFWATTEYFIPPDSVFDKPFVRNGIETPAWKLEYEQEPFYKTDVFTDYAIRFLNKSIESRRPFFLYLPYHAAHYPLQARPEDIELFRGKYMRGWDVLRKERYERMVSMGVLDAKYALSEPTENINKYRGHPEGDEDRRALIPKYRPWETLNDQEKEELDLEMAVFAAIVHRMDLNIGRVIQLLEDSGALDNTVIMYLSDNGSCPYDSNRDFEVPPGPASSYRTLSAAWANLGNTPFRYFKQFGHEGGAHTHFIVRWPDAIENGGGFTDHPGHVVDIFPTFLDIAGLEYPTSYQGMETLPLDGQSLLKALAGEKMPEPEVIMSGRRENFRMFRKGDWKIVRLNAQDWELYNVKDDLTEIDDLAAERPEVLHSMIAAYEKWKSESELPVPF
jgi:arylsulfatase